MNYFLIMSVLCFFTNIMGFELMNSIKRPGVGIGVIIIRDGKILLGKRKNSHGKESWCPPGGHLEFGESFQECARRETFEETGLIINDSIQGPTVNNIFVEDDKHYITVFMITKSVQGEAYVAEPDKCEEWQWFTPEHLPKPLFLPVESLFKQGFEMNSYYSSQEKEHCY